MGNFVIRHEGTNITVQGKEPVLLSAEKAIAEEMAASTKAFCENDEYECFTNVDEFSKKIMANARHEKLVANGPAHGGNVLPIRKMADIYEVCHVASKNLAVEKHV